MFSPSFNGPCSKLLDLWVSDGLSSFVLTPHQARRQACSRRISAGGGACAPGFYHLRSSAQICGKGFSLAHGDFVHSQVFNHHFLAIPAILAIPERRI
jgi:hypothetical protein